MASSSSSFPSSSSISSTSQWKYDVFLSFRGEDTRNTAVDFLNYALQRRGIYIFKDDEKLEGGKTIKPELLKAIEESRFAVVILSENYASSTWCLEELVKIIDCEKEKGMTVLPIFYNVDPSDLRKLKGAFAKAFDEHEKQFKEKVGTWRDALNHVAGIAGYHVKNSPLSEAVKWIVGQLSHKSIFEFSEITAGLVGMHSRLVELESCLALWLKDDVRSIGFWAMGGMGKSTLAKVAYKMFSKEFDDCCFIDDVRKKDLFSLQKDLISQILKETNLNIQSKLNGEHMIKKMLPHKKVLLVLDDVDESNKLAKLVKSDWFGSGSRIIITTRDKQLLKEFSVDEILQVKALNYKDALCLFCSKAFKKEQCPDEYLKLSISFLEYVKGLPLALEVLGSFLFEKSTAEWKSALEMLKEHSEPTVIQVLKISYDGLQEPVQEIFKDIACFFNHEKENHVVRMLNILGRHPHIGLSILIDKSLLEISKNNELWMHDFVEDMGRDIVRQESLEPGERSRLWLYKDIDQVLKNNTGTGKVQAISIKGAKDTSICHEEKEACWRPQGLAPLVTLQEGVLSTLSWQGLALSVTLWGWVQRTLSWQGFTSSKKQKWHPNAFLKMPNLKFLRILNISLQLDTLPNSLRYLEFNDYPFKSLPPLPEELVELHLQRSRIELLWGGIKNFDKLRFINMVDSSNLIIVPDFDGVPNLEELVLTGCSNLCKLHPSIGKLKKLKLLNLTRCSQVKKIPEFVGNMKLLQELLLECTAIRTLPSSIECLTSLNILILRDCKQLVSLPNTICSLTSLKELDLFRCSKFDKLPEDLGDIVSLRKLYLSGTAIKELPSSFGFLIHLTSLDLTNCKDFVLLPCTIGSLKSLHKIILSGCSKFVNLPETLGNLGGLFILSLKGTAIEVLPSFIGRLTGLMILDIRDCKNLVCLPDNIGCLLFSLIALYLRGNNFVSLPESISQLSRIRMLNLNGCKRLRSLPDIPSQVYFVSVNNCTSLERFPESPKNCPFWSCHFDFCVSCVNCFNIQFCVKGLNGKLVGRLPSIFPGKEIPNGFVKANIRDSSVLASLSFHRCDYSVNKRSPWLGFHELRAILVCVVLVPCEHYNHPKINIKSFEVDGLFHRSLDSKTWRSTGSKYGKLESHHLLLSLQYLNFFDLETPGCSIDEKEFHEVEFKITTWSVEVETVGFRLLNKQDIKSYANAC